MDSPSHVVLAPPRAREVPQHVVFAPVQHVGIPQTHRALSTSGHRPDHSTPGATGSRPWKALRTSCSRDRGPLSPPLHVVLGACDVMDPPFAQRVLSLHGLAISSIDGFGEFDTFGP